MIKSIFICIALCVSSLMIGQANDQFFAAMKKNDLVNMEQVMSNRIEISIDGNHDRLSKGEAIRLIEKFIKGKRIVSIKNQHSGESKNQGSNYGVAVVNTESGNYRVFIYLEGKDEKLISEIRIDKM